MLAGVEILLERMKTNPEEFVDGGYSKWSRVLDRSWDILTEEEHKALKDAHTQAKREHFNGEVMRVLSGDVEETTNTEDYMNPAIHKGKSLMQGNRSAIVAPQSMIAQANGILNQEFDKAYAGQQNTANNSAWWDGTSPYQQRK
jgi:hypothetical protein